MACHPCAPELRSIFANYTHSFCAVKSPSEWLIERKEHIFTTLDRIDLSPEEVVTLEHNISVYPCLLVYTFAHVKFCSRNASLLNALKEELSKWRGYDEWKKLLQHSVIKTTLCQFLGLHQEPHDNRSCNAKENVQSVLDLDMAYTAAQIHSILRDSERNLKKKFLTLSDGDAQSALNLLQALHDFTKLDHRLRPRLVGALYTLSKKSSLYPECLILRGVTHQGRDAVAGGAFGDVWMGDIRGSPIAIKVMRVWTATDIRKFLKAFSVEAVLWRQLSHPNVLPFYGVYHWNDELSRICLVSPWMENGNLVQYLERHPKVDRIPLLRDIANGLCYLHSYHPCIIHGDLKGANILITPRGRACITDFGLSRLVNESRILLTSSGATSDKGGTLPWQAPELIDFDSNAPKENSVASDVYAYGGVCYEAFVGCPPFYDLKNGPMIMSAVLKGHRPVRPPGEQYISLGLDDVMWALTQRCWNTSPDSRPSANEIVEILSMRLASLTVDASDWDSTILAQLRPTLPTVPPTGLLEKLGVAHSSGLNSTAGIQSLDGGESSTPRPCDSLGLHATFWKLSTTTSGQDMDHMDAQATSLISPDRSQESSMDVDSQVAYDSASSNGPGHPKYTDSSESSNDMNLHPETDGNEDFVIAAEGKPEDTHPPQMEVTGDPNNSQNQHTDPNLQPDGVGQSLSVGLGKALAGEAEERTLLPRLPTEIIATPGHGQQTEPPGIRQDASRSEGSSELLDPESNPNQTLTQTHTPDPTIGGLLYQVHPITPGCAIHWDLRTPPELAFLCRPGTVSRFLEGYEREQLAILPPTLTLTIMCPIFPHVWPIKLKFPEVITVGTVLQAIHQTVNQPIRRSEWRVLSSGLQKRIANAFNLRCFSSKDPEGERSKGVRRVDCLRMYTNFGGLVWKSVEDGVCEMRLSRISSTPSGSPPAPNPVDINPMQSGTGPDAQTICYAIAVPTSW